MGLDKNFELMNLCSLNSLAKQPFGKMIKLSESGISPLEIPDRFKIRSFIPHNGLNLEGISRSISKDLVSLGITERGYIAQTTSGVCEAVKNAYEHGNREDSTKEIFFAKSYEKGKAEFLVGDQGGEIRGNFVPFVLLFRQKGHERFLMDVPDFYRFSGRLYAPQGHSGVGTKTMNIGFDDIEYFVGSNGGLLVYLGKHLPNFGSEK